jgi:hypothetical protein
MGSRSKSSRCYTTGPSRARSRFVTAPYHLSLGGTLVPECPTVCAWADGVSQCRVRLKIVRSRKTGPRHDLWVFYCPVHGVYFTVYPPGYLPFARQAVVAVMPDGSAPDDDADAKSDAVPPLMEGTLPGVAWDARDEKTWRVACQRPDCWRTTLVRHLDRATHLVGVAADVGPDKQLTCAETLAVDLLRLREGQAMIGNEPGVIGRGRAVVHVLEEVLRVGRNLLDRLVAAAHLGGLCGRPFRWVARVERLVPLVAV